MRSSTRDAKRSVPQVARGATSQRFSSRSRWRVTHAVIRAVCVRADCLPGELVRRRHTLHDGWNAWKDTASDSSAIQTAACGCCRVYVALRFRLPVDEKDAPSTRCLLQRTGCLCARWYASEACLPLPRQVCDSVRNCSPPGPA